MTNWTAGYVADIDYTHGYYRELTRALIGFASAMANVAQLPSLTRFRYCELGCGQGFSANIIAATHPDAEIHATDFNPSHIAGARQLAAEAGLSNIHFHEHAFADFADEPSLPDSFDIIALHGIYSWISSENRRHIAAFVRRKLRPGGLLYISYNTLPGWAPLMPLRRLLVDQGASRVGPVAARIDEGIALAESLIKINAGYFAQNGVVAGRLEKMKGMSRSYLAHEYMNADWTPFYFADVVEELGEAKLSFLTSAHLLDAVDVINLTADQQALLNNVPDPVRRQSLRDYLVNQQFRRDIFVKGGPLLPQTQAQSQMLDLRFALGSPKEAVPMKLQGLVGEVQLQPDVYSVLLDRLAAGPATLRQLLGDRAIADLGWARLRQAFSVLVGTGHVHPCLPAEGEAKRAQRTKAFNAAVMRRAEWSSDLNHLASPVTGGGIQSDRLEQLLFGATAQKGVDPAERVWSLLTAQGQKIIKDGKTLETPEENLAELRERLAAFADKRLPILKQLGIA